MPSVSIPAEPADLTAAWFSGILGATVTSVELLDAHSGTTGRARVGLAGADDVPPSVFVKLQPFHPEQRKFLRQIGLGIAEARLYAAMGGELPVRIPKVWHAACDPSDGSFVMVLEDLSGCRFPTPADDDIVAVAESLVSELALCTHLPRQRSVVADSGRRHAASTHRQRARGATHTFHQARPRTVRRRTRYRISRDGRALHRTFWRHHRTLRGGRATLIHGDDHCGNLFVDGGRTGFYDWAVACRAPGVRDVAYFLCNSLPVETRRSEQDSLLARYRAALAHHGWALDADAVDDQYRLFAVYSWVAAVSTAAMGTRWQPEEVTRPALLSTTAAIDDLDVPGLLAERL